MKLSFDMSQVVDYAGRLARAATKVRPDPVAKRLGTILLARTRAYASGRPGPNVITGAYRSSIRVRYEGNPAAGTVMAVVGSDAPQAARLEFGFRGVDSLGRKYDQPPFPHFSRALDDIDRQLPLVADQAAMQWTRDL